MSIITYCKLFKITCKGFHGFDNHRPKLQIKIRKANTDTFLNQVFFYTRE